MWWLGHRRRRIRTSIHLTPAQLVPFAALCDLPLRKEGRAEVLETLQRFSGDLPAFQHLRSHRALVRVSPRTQLWSYQHVEKYERKEPFLSCILSWRANPRLICFQDFSALRHKSFIWQVCSSCFKLIDPEIKEPGECPPPVQRSVPVPWEEAGEEPGGRGKGPLPSQRALPSDGPDTHSFSVSGTGWKAIEMFCCPWRQVELTPLTFVSSFLVYSALGIGMTGREPFGLLSDGSGWVCRWEILLFQGHVNGIRWDEGGLPFGMCVLRSMLLAIRTEAGTAGS